MENLTNTPTRNPHAGKGEAEYARSLAEYETLTKEAALVDRSHRTILKLTGKDPVGMLNAILTNEVPRAGNTGAYAALLNPKGRLQTDLRVLKADEDVLVDTEPEGAEAAREILGRYAPFSRVKIKDLSAKGSWGILGLYGPRAHEFLGNLQLAEHESTEVEVGDTKVLAAGVTLPVTGLDLLGPEEALRAVREHLEQAGAKPIGPEAYETIRVEAGLPRFGVDITPENFPAEAGILDRAVSFSKGCYPGQETVAKMYYRGRPNRTLYRLEIEGSPPSPSAPILQEEKHVGTVTSIAPLTIDGRTLALGYLSRNAQKDAPLSAGEAAVLPIP